MREIGIESRGEKGGGRDPLRAAAVVAAGLGAIGSLLLLSRAGANTPRFLLVLFVGWILLPFAAAGWALRRSPRWPVPVRAALALATVACAGFALAAYGGWIPKPKGAANAFYWVAAPPLSLAFLLVAVALGLFVHRRRQRAT